MQRVNFASRVLSDPGKPGIQAMIGRLRDLANGRGLSAEELVDACLHVVGPLEVPDSTCDGLIEYARSWGDVSFADAASTAQAERTIVALLQLVVTTQEYQMV